MKSQNRLIILGALVLVTANVIAAPKDHSENCSMAVPNFYDELYKQYQGKIATYAAYSMLTHELKKPIKDKSNFPHWVKGYQIDRICIYGEVNKRAIKAWTKSIVSVPPESSDTGKQEFLLIDTVIEFDPDRDTITHDEGYRETVSPITGSMIRALDYYGVFSEKNENIQGANNSQKDK